ncbi:MAG: hypothetical protein ACRETK_10230 [Steroidobacteraceae bacterium]
MRRAFSPAILASLRELPTEVVLARLALDFKTDPTFAPVKDAGTRRWHAHTTQGDFEILTTGPKWYDTRARKGGGGAIDLAMHVLGLSFVEAVKRLTADAALHGPDHP